MKRAVVFGTGATGRAVARELRSRDVDVTMVNRSGAAAVASDVRVVAGNAANTENVRSLTAGTDAIFNCLNPKYHQWLTAWPPMANALLQGAIANGAVLCTLSNLYAYGSVRGPMKPTDPLNSTLPKAQVRAAMWSKALAEHQAGRVRCTEVRASDFIGPNSESQFERYLPRMKAGKSVMVLSNPDIIHSWTYIDDVARTLVAAASSEAAWGRPWHAATNAPATIRQVLQGLSDELALEMPKVSVLPSAALKTIGLFSPIVRELPKVMYQFKAPFVIDDSLTRSELGIEPTPWETVIARTAQNLER